MDYHDVEWFALETNRDHSVVFEITGLKKNSPGDPPCMVERSDLTPVLALGWVGLRSPEARLPLPESLPVVIPLPFSLGEALSPSLVSVVGSARP